MPRARLHSGHGDGRLASVVAARLAGASGRAGSARACAVPRSGSAGGGVVTVTRVITYTYDPLHRLTGAEYSTGERYE